jgi:propionyl-CoA synthetase
MASRASDLQSKVHRLSIDNAEAFWAAQAQHLDWHTEPSATLHRSQKTLSSGVTHDTWSWFPGGEISTCHNCLDRHVLAGHGGRAAIYYDSPVTGTKAAYTYQQLLDEVEVFAGALREMGVGKGDVVMLYSESGRAQPNPVHHARY